MGWKNNEGSSKGLFPESVRNTLGPLLLILITPFVALVLSRAVTRPGGGFLQGVFDAFMEVTVNPVDFVFRDALDPTAWKIIAVYSGFELLLMRLMPGPEFRGPISPCGNVPLYKLNGVKCFLFSVAAFGAGVYLKIFPGSIVFDNFVKLTAAMNLFAFGFCGFLTVKGFCFPSSSDSGSSGNVVMDFYWGTELYPRILGWDVKVFTNCRFGMMFWGLGSISFACAQYEHHGVLTLPMLVSVSLQFIYVFKFFWWESGYFKTIDIMHDRAGYYICWGCLVWLPTLYTSPASFLVHHREDWQPLSALVVFVAGVVAIYLNYWVDIQRQEFRAKDGRMKINGKEAEFIVASYETEDGKKHESKLLLSGWWGMSRKINYVFEILSAFLWSVPFAHPTFLTPNLYWIFLVILLLDRAYRDDVRCREKYGKDWNRYCECVPYLLFPGIW